MRIRQQILNWSAEDYGWEGVNLKAEKWLFTRRSEGSIGSASRMSCCNARGSNLALNRRLQYIANVSSTIPFFPLLDQSCGGDDPNLYPFCVRNPEHKRALAITEVRRPERMRFIHAVLLPLRKRPLEGGCRFSLHCRPVEILVHSGRLLPGESY